ncbi:unnamed protein product [Pedinophyceae sp. YPF-701]|nr:unnamed protein product [Pedinophyceae sp. YPF-701]
MSAPQPTAAGAQPAAAANAPASAAAAPGVPPGMDTNSKEYYDWYYYVYTPWAQQQQQQQQQQHVQQQAAAAHAFHASPYAQAQSHYAGYAPQNAPPRAAAGAPYGAAYGRPPLAVPQQWGGAQQHQRPPPHGPAPASRDPRTPAPAAAAPAQQPNAYAWSTGHNHASQQQQAQQPQARPSGGGVVIRPQMSKAAVASANAAKAAAQQQEQQPAYIAVGSTAAPTPAPAPAQSQPPSLKPWVERALLACRTPEQTSEMKAALRAMVERANARGDLWRIDWAQQPVPAVTGVRPAAAKGRSRWGARPDAESPRGAAGGFAGGELPGSFGGGKKARGRKRGRKFDYDAGGADSPDGGSLSPRARAALERRSARFASGDRKRARVTEDAAPDWGGGEWEDEVPSTVVGTCQELEKSYHRLHGPPPADTVRPAAVLERALARLQGLLDSGQTDYWYACDQLKAMRQDCAVQGVRTELTVRIYEAHARAALSYGDTGEFNACQSQLALLYREGVSGSQAEFLAYRILYQALFQRDRPYELLRTLRETYARGMHGDGAVAHALRVRAALAAGSYRELFRLWGDAPHCSGDLIGSRINHLRLDAARVAVKAYRPTLAVAAMVGMLGFDGEEEDEEGGAEGAAEEWLRDHGAEVVAGGEGGGVVVDCRKSVGKLRLPERNAVAHGDANMSVENFLKQL